MGARHVDSVRLLSLGSGVGDGGVCSGAGGPGEFVVVPDGRGESKHQRRSLLCDVERQRLEFLFVHVLGER